MHPCVAWFPPHFEPCQVVIWNVSDCPAYDAEGQSDLFVKGNVDLALGPTKTQATDVHFRSKTGKGSFNWRMVWPLSLSPSSERWPRLRVAVNAHV